MATPAVSNPPGTIVTVILAVLLPPVAVALHRGVSTQFWINLVLTLLSFGILGIVHALIVCLA